MPNYKVGDGILESPVLFVYLLCLLIFAQSLKHWLDLAETLFFFKQGPDTFNWSGDFIALNYPSPPTSIWIWLFD